MSKVSFGIFEWLDRGTVPVQRLYEDRLHLLEIADRAHFFCYHLARLRDRRRAARCVLSQDPAKNRRGLSTRIVAIVSSLKPTSRSLGSTTRNM